MKPLLLRLLGNAIALYAATTLIDGIQFGAGGEGDFGGLVAVTLIFGAVNAIIKPIVRLATCPVYLVTLGLFTFVVNALMLLLTGWLAALFNVDFQIDGFGPAFRGAIVVSLVSFFLSLIISAKNNDRN